MVEENLDKIRPYLKDIVNYLKRSDTWKIQLKITINFISSKDDNDQERVMIKISDEADEVIRSFLIHSKLDIRIIFNQWEAVSLFSIMFTYGIIKDLK